MDEIICVLGKKIKFTKERYAHIVARHPELEGKQKEIIKALTDADFVQESVYDKTYCFIIERYERNMLWLL